MVVGTVGGDRHRSSQSSCQLTTWLFDVGSLFVLLEPSPGIIIIIEHTALTLIVSMNPSVPLCSASGSWYHLIPPDQEVKTSFPLDRDVSCLLGEDQYISLYPKQPLLKDLT